MDNISIILIGIFFATIISIAFEHSLGVNKSWIALLAGTLMWMIVSFGSDPKIMHHALQEGSAEIFELIIFLMGAMTIVEMMGHYRFFTWIESKLFELNISNTILFWILGAITFFCSALLDNLTTTLVMLQVGRQLYLKKENFNIYAINVVIAANAGGAMSPVGDVTTIMMWLAHKFTAWQILAYGFLPSLIAWAIPQFILTRQIIKEDRKGRMSKEVLPLQWSIILLGFMTFGFAVLVNLLDLPPFFGILFGLGVAAIVIDFRLKHGKLKKKENRIVNVIKSIDMATITFFIGILLAVNALNFYGILDQFAHLLFGESPGSKETVIVMGHSILGVVSSVVDNVPLTAAVIDMLPDGVHFQYWVLLAITAGTGGSILVIGSAAGVAAMGQVSELSITYYLKKGTLPAALGYLAAIGMWMLQKYLMGV
ncbi:sodium:proton antiporter NhaD [Reichenbachiella sp. MALMAid0571]|uniref:sodium:proton antiporter NhaD n=1 Tax=Reichenbachiella sp. MALMAid0571 TaxID=3143939 RepID=UPI0032DE44D6